MPSIVRVTNLENGRTIKVRINDRGPFHSNRIIDLSKRSAEMLGITGLAKVRVVYVKEDTDKLRSGLGIAPETYPTLASLEGQAQDQAVQQSGSRIIESKAPIQEIQSRDISSNDLPPPSSPRSANTTPTTTIQEDVATMAEEYERATSSSGTASTNYGVPKESGVKAPNQNQGQNQGSNKDPNQYAGDFRTSGEIKPSELYNQEGQQPAQRPPQQQTNTQPNLPNKLPPQNTKVVANNSSSGVSAAQQKNAGNLASLGKYIQAGAFSVKENAYNVAQKLTGLAPVIVKLVEVNSQQLYRVRVGPFADDSTARLALQKVIEIGLKDAKIVTN
jgi:cell division septation protein DedD